MQNAKRKVNYIDGITPNTARKIAEEKFREKFYSLKVNDKEFTYDVFLLEGVSKELIKDFKEFWGGNWRIFIYKEEA